MNDIFIRLHLVLNFVLKLLPFNVIGLFTLEIAILCAQLKFLFVGFLPSGRVEVVALSYSDVFVC